MTLKQVEKELFHSTEMRKKAKKDLDDARDALESKEHETQVRDLAINILEAYLESVSGSVSDTLEGLMKSALQVFNMGVEVKMEYKEGARGGYMVSIVQDGVEGNIESFGGGVMSLISFIMLIATIVLKNKKRFIVLDESLKEVSSEYQESLSNFMRQLCEDFEFTILLISHQPDLNIHANHHYEVSVNKNSTVIQYQQ